jgi:hypothetical protein
VDPVAVPSAAVLAVEQLSTRWDLETALTLLDLLEDTVFLGKACCFVEVSLSDVAALVVVVALLDVDLKAAIAILS